MMRSEDFAVTHRLPSAFTFLRFFALLFLQSTTAASSLYRGRLLTAAPDSVLFKEAPEA